MITLIAGGVGAARLLRGLVRVVPAKDLTVIVNTADDDVFYGLHVSPDIDTILYTLAGIAPIERGWGIEDDSFSVRAELDTLCGAGWFALGDRDLATHIQRTRRLSEGATLSDVTRELSAARGIRVRVLPMSDDPVRTIVTTTTGDLAFQEYLVRRRARPRVVRVRYRGARTARPARGVLDAISRSRIVILAPSNPFVSLGPILAVPGVRKALARVRDRVVAVSPLIGGRAVKGPLAAMLRSMGRRTDNSAIASIYKDVASRLIVAPGDAPARGLPQGVAVAEHDILLVDPERAETLARFLLSGFFGSGRKRSNTK
ncbi:MAG TPA: 2-phospho-L-lactate transferase [Candidatus Limnocylindrales bacterium]|nr:2-phospho-L-lactate transferase [Candidatus Limnocylindrales bacterium]